MRQLNWPFWISSLIEIRPFRWKSFDRCDFEVRVFHRRKIFRQTGSLQLEADVQRRRSFERSASWVFGLVSTDMCCFEQFRQQGDQIRHCSPPEISRIEDCLLWNSFQAFCRCSLRSGWTSDLDPAVRPVGTFIFHIIQIIQFGHNFWIHILVDPVQKILTNEYQIVLACFKIGVANEN